jgi:hypothetical protein
MSTSYTQLSTDIELATENEDTDFIAQIPEFVSRTQYRLHRDLDTYGFVIYTSVSASTGQYLITKPSSALIIKSLYRVSGGARKPMLLRTDEYINEYWPDRTSVTTTSPPKYYSNWGFNQWYIAPPAPVNTNFEISMVGVPVSIGSGTATNWLTDYAPEALFYGCMVEACQWMKNYGAAQTWEAQYQSAVGALRNEARRTRMDDQINNENPRGADNPWQKGST